MTKREAAQTFLTSGIFDDWHWVAYHFRFYMGGLENPFARSIVETCLDCELRLPGFTAEAAQRIGAVRGRDHHQPHYEQLLQLLAELLVVRQVVTVRCSPRGESHTPRYRAEESSGRAWA